MAKPQIDVNHLFIAVPELVVNVKLIDSLRSQGVISEAQYAKFVNERRKYTKAQRVAAALSGGSLIERLLAVAPELISEDMVDLLRGIEVDRSRLIIHNDRRPHREKVKFDGLITAEQATSLKLAIRTLNAASRGGLPSDARQIATRLGRVLGVQLSNTRINQLVGMEVLTAKEGERVKNAVAFGGIAKESLVKALRAKSLLDALLLLGKSRVDLQVVQQMVASGLLPDNLGRAYDAALRLGIKEWRVFSGARSAEGLQRRMLLVLTGSFNRPLLDLAYELGVINGRQWSGLRIAELLSRRVNDKLVQDLTKRRYRVQIGEAPIRTFARASRNNDNELLKLLAQASKEASKEAAALAKRPGIGASTRSRQYNLASRGLHEAMRSLWDGVGYLTIFGEREVAAAAAESAIAMQRSLLSGKFAQLGKSLEYQAKAGVDSYISRQENTLKLSRLVYKNLALTTGAIDKRISIGLLNGSSPAEIAADIEKYISPNVRGGVSYAAMRLARTEINNAFHFSTIRYTRENPWVRGYQWNLSGSHGRPDICNDYATDDHDGLGPGVFKKVNVPGKPHPHCLCYITVVQMSPEEFVAASNAGRFDRFYKSVREGTSYGDQPGSGSLAEYARRGLANAPKGISL